MTRQTQDPACTRPLRAVSSRRLGPQVRRLDG